MSRSAQANRLAVTLTAVLAAAGLGGCQGDHQGALAVVVAMPEQDIPSGANATILVDYASTGARILGEGGGPACAFVLPGLKGSFSDDGQGKLTVKTTDSRALRALSDIAACRMEAGDPEATAADLQSKLVVRVDSAEDGAGKALDLAAHTSKSRGKGHRSQSEVEAAQQDAVRAMVAAAPPVAPGSKSASGSDATADGGEPAPASGGRSGSAMGTGIVPGRGRGDFLAKGGSAISQNPGGGGAGPTASASVPQPTRSGSPAPDDGAVPIPRDADPTYDDSVGQSPAAPAFSLDIAVQGNERFGALQLEITHLGNNGGFIGRGDQIDCVPLVEAIVAGNYVGERVARLGMISLQGIPSPSLILRCGFRTRESISPASFLIEVTDASDVDSKPLEPFPTVAIVGIYPR